MNTIDANDLKTLGISAIEAALAERHEVAITVAGIQRFVVMDVNDYRELYESELERSLAEARADIAAGRYVTESPEAHIKRLIGEYHVPVNHT